MTLLCRSWGPAHGALTAWSSHICCSLLSFSWTHCNQGRHPQWHLLHSWDSSSNSQAFWNCCHSCCRALQISCRLQAAAAAAAAETVLLSHTGSGASSSTVGRTQPSNSGQGTAAPQPKFTQRDWPSRPDLLLLKDAMHLLATYTAFAVSWPRGKFAFELVPACAPAVVELASISFQRVSQLLEHHQMDTVSYNDLTRVWVQADEAVRLAFIPDIDPSYIIQNSMSFLESDGMQRYHSVLFALPQTGQCMAVMLATAVYNALLLQLPRLPDLSASSSSSNGDRSSRSKRGRKVPILQCSDPKQAWTYAREQQQMLPPSHQELLQHAGITSTSVLFVAACLVAASQHSDQHNAACTIAGNRLYSLMYIYGCFCTHHVDLMPQHNQHQHRHQQQQQQHGVSQGQPQQPLLFCLMPCVLLYWAAVQPPTLPSGLRVNLAAAVFTSRGAITAAMQLAVHSSMAGMPLLPRTASNSCRKVCPFIPASVRERVLADVLTLATRIAAYYVASLAAESSDSSTGTSSSSSSTSTSSSSSSRGSSSSGTSSGVGQASGGIGGATSMPAMQQVATQPDRKHGLAAELVHLLAMLSEDMDFSTASAAGDVGAAQVLPPASAAAVWQQHTLAVARLLEGTVRHGKVTGSMLMGLIGDSGPGPLAAGSRAAGPGSPEQQQLISLLCSTVKPVAAPREHLAGLQALDCLHILAAATAALCKHSSRAAAGAEGSCKTALAAVPWLAIVGRCLLLLAALLPTVCTPRAVGQIRVLVQQVGPAGTSNGMQSVLAMLNKGVQQVADTLQGLLLSDDGPTSLTAQLTAAVYSSWEAIPAQLQPVAHAVEALEEPNDSPPFDSLVSTAAELMTALGLPLNTLAFPTTCNNPRCSNLSGPSELQLVSGRGNMCAGCRVARYCGRDCQRQHWKQHKPACKALAAAADKAANADSPAAAAAAALSGCA